MSNQIAGVLRAVVPAMVAYLVGRGYISEAAAADVTAAIIAMVAAIWSWQSNKDA